MYTIELVVQHDIFFLQDLIEIYNSSCMANMIKIYNGAFRKYCIQPISTKLLPINTKLMLIFEITLDRLSTIYK